MYKERYSTTNPPANGKSSFFHCLLQMLDISSGKIAVNGIDLSHCPREAVRSAFVTVPQDPVLYEGSIRFNLDPQGLAGDIDIEKSLHRVQPWHIISRNPGLDASVDSLHLSQGQR
jgi:ATP-binding cassette subfamily C (CFTR/MRP) protein 1